jgi:hypothetical protein
VLSDIAKKPYSTKPQCQQLKALWETAKLWGCHDGMAMSWPA